MSDNRVLILGDSLTFGRPKHQIYYEESWPGLLQSRGFDIFHRGRGGADAVAVLQEARHCRSYMSSMASDGYMPFKYCVVQVGIVDCTPRVFSRKFLGLSAKIPGLRKMVSSLSSKKSLVSKIGRPWVNERLFQSKLTELLKVLKTLCEVIVLIEVARPVHNLVLNCGDYSCAVAKYNEILQSLPGAYFLPVFDATESLYLLPDGHHLNAAGHQLIAEKLHELVGEIEGDRR